MHSIQRMLEEARAGEQLARETAAAARRAKEAAIQDKEAALAEIARLKALLQQQKDG